MTGHSGQADRACAQQALLRDPAGRDSEGHHSIFDALLSMLDEALLTDRLGRIADFRNTIIVMTTNLGVSSGTAIGFADNRTGQVSIGEIKAFFRPEFFNRIDRMLTVNSLERETIEKIAERDLRLLQQRPGIAQRGIKLLFTPILVEQVSRGGFSPKYGARPFAKGHRAFGSPGLDGLVVGERAGQGISSAAWF